MSMHQEVRRNFEEKASYAARRIDGMTVTDQGNFLCVDCGLPSDTFNVIVVRNVTAQAQLLASIDRFTARKMPLAVWCWEGDVEPNRFSLFTEHGLTHNEIDTAMYADLTAIQPPSLIEGLEIRPAMTTNDVLSAGLLMAAAFGESGEANQSIAYYERLCEYPLGQFPAMHYYLGILHGTLVATGLLFIGSQSAGIYDVFTSEQYRRRGIGSAMFQHLLQEARNHDRRVCVLQASPDGLGIYLQAGFESVDAVHVFENRALL